MAQTRSPRTPPAKASPPAFPNVPPSWTTETSCEHWVPSAETRGEIAKLLKAAVKEPATKRRATWARAAKLLPPGLVAIIGKAATNWGTVASPEVAHVAMDLIRYAAQPGADVERVERELERILPDLPMVSLNGVVDGASYIAATNEIDAAARDNPELSSLQLYLSSS